MVIKSIVVRIVVFILQINMNLITQTTTQSNLKFIFDKTYCVFFIVLKVFCVFFIVLNIYLLECALICKFISVLLVHGMEWLQMMLVCVFAFMLGQCSAWKLLCFWKMNVLYWGMHLGKLRLFLHCSFFPILPWVLMYLVLVKMVLLYAAMYNP